MILDNHKAHRSKMVEQRAYKYGIKLMFMPPTASELNPIEVMWSFFKGKWKRKLYDKLLMITPENSV